ncbi:MAG: sensor histidine kinase, partial [Kangiellaceae bacterium]
NENNEYYGKQIPEELTRLHQYVLYRKHPMTAFKEEKLFVGGLRIPINNKMYSIYLQQRVPFLSHGFFGIVIREFSKKLMLTAFVASFPFSLFLAWFFSRPIRQLQQTTKQLMLDLNNRKELLNLTKRNDEFGDLAKDFNQLAEHLKNQLELKNRFLGDVSHELRSPLARMQIALGLAENELEKNPNEQLLSAIDRFRLEANRINAMVSGLLDSASVDDANSKNNFVSSNLNNLLQSLIDDAKYESEELGITITSDIENSLILVADESQLVSCFDNILRNAIRYTKDEIRISVFKQDGQIKVTIEDNGQGVPEEAIDKLCESFYRPETDRSRKSGGVGLGLSIVKQVVKNHNGELKLSNIQNSKETITGFHVSVSLPVDS